MGFIRSFLLVIVSILLFVSLLIMGFFATVSSSLSYENVQKQIYPIANQIIEEQIGTTTLINNLEPYLLEYCKNNSEVVKNIEGYIFVFPCEIIESGGESIIEYGINYFIKNFYYKEYSCEFWKCFEEQEIPLFLVSEYSHQYWKKFFFNFLLISLGLSFILILLSKKKSNGFILTGILLTFTAFITLKLDKIGIFLSNFIISPISTALTEETTSSFLPKIINIFFSNSNRIFVWMFVIAIVLILAGILLRLFGIGFKLSGLFGKIQEKKEENKEQEETEKAKKSIGKEKNKKPKKNSKSKDKKNKNKDKNNFKLFSKDEKKKKSKKKNKK